jgi:hypothetical protein
VPAHWVCRGVISLPCRGCLSRYMAYNRFSTTTTCPDDQLLQISRYPRSLWPVPAGCLSGWKAISGIPGTNWQVLQDAPNRATSTPNQGLRWPCGTPVGDPTAAGRRGMTGHGRARGRPAKRLSRAPRSRAWARAQNPKGGRKGEEVEVEGSPGGLRAAGGLGGGGRAACQPRVKRSAFSL